MILVKRDSTTSLLSVKDIRQQEIKTAKAITISAPLLRFEATVPIILGDSN